MRPLRAARRILASGRAAPRGRHEAAMDSSQARRGPVIDVPSKLTKGPLRDTVEITDARHLSLYLPGMTDSGV